MDVNKPYYQDEWATLYHASAWEMFPLVWANSADLVLTDPPYTADVHKNAKRGYKEGTKAFITIEPFTVDDIRRAFTEIGRVARAWVVSFLADDHTYMLKQDYAPKVKPAPALKFVRAGVWVKPNTAPHVNQDRPSQGWESIAMLHQRAWAGKYQWHGKRLRRNHAVFTYPFVSNGKHPNQKPIPLLVELIELLTGPGQVVLDPFCGAGSMLVAAKQAGRRSIGFEIDPAYCAIAAQRLAETRPTCSTSH